MTGRRLLLAFGAYAAIAVAAFRLSPSELSHTSPSMAGDPSDALLYMWAIHHVSTELFRDPLALFDAGIFHPSPNTLAYSDHMIGQALIGLPIWWATGNPVLEFNLLVLLSYALSATGLCAYARKLLGSDVAAFVAGAAFAFTPYRFDSAAWLQLLFTVFMPLTLLGWLRFCEKPSLMPWLAWVGCWVLHGLMGMYLALLFSLVMCVLVAYGLLAGPMRTDRRFQLGSLAAPVAVLAALAPTLWPYVRFRIDVGLQRPGLDWPFLDLLLPGAGSLSAELLGLDASSLRGPGLAVSALALAGIAMAAARARTSGPVERFQLFVQGLGLGLGLLLCALPVRVVQALPVLDALRTNSRGLTIVLLFLAVFVGVAVAGIARRMRTSAAGLVAALALGVLVCLDMGAPRYARIELPTEDAATRWLREQRESGAVWDRAAPGTPFAQALSMLRAVDHGRPLIGGYSGFASPSWSYFAYRIARFPSPDSISLLDRLGVRWIVLRGVDQERHGRLLERVAEAAEASAARGTGARLAARLGSDLVFRVEPSDATGMAQGDATGEPVVASQAHFELPLTRDALSSNGPAAGLDRLLDASRDTVWGFVPEPGDEPPWLAIDLGRARLISGVRCAPAAPDAPGIYRAQVEVSVDGRNWELASKQFEPSSLDTFVARPARLDAFEALFEPRSVRHLRIVNPKLVRRARRAWKEGFEMAEVRVLAPCDGDSAHGCPPPAVR